MVRMDTLNSWQVVFWKGFHGAVLSMMMSPQIYPDDWDTDFHCKDAPWYIIAPLFPGCQFQPGVSLCSWPSPTPCHLKGLSSSYPGHLIQFVFTTLTFQSLLLAFATVCLISFLDLLSSQNSLLWLTLFYFLFLALQPPKTLAFIETLTHSPWAPDYRSRKSRLRHISPAGISSLSQMICIYLSIFQLQIRFSFPFFFKFF